MIYPVDSVIHPLNNWGLGFDFRDVSNINWLDYCCRNVEQILECNSVRVTGTLILEVEGNITGFTTHITHQVCAECFRFFPRIMRLEASGRVGRVV